MNILLIVIAIIAIILLLTGGFVSSLNFLLWVGIILLVIAVIVWLVRMLTGSRRVGPERGYEPRNRDRPVRHRRDPGVRSERPAQLGGPPSRGVHPHDRRCCRHHHRHRSAHAPPPVGRDQPHGGRPGNRRAGVAQDDRLGRPARLTPTPSTDARSP